MEKALKTSDRYLTLGTVVKMQSNIGKMSYYFIKQNPKQT